MTKTVYGIDGVRVVVDDAQVKRLFEVAPRATFRWMRDFVGRCFGSHRREWIARTAVRLNIPGGANFDRENLYGGIFGKARSFRYRVNPPQGQIPANPSLDQINGRVYTDNRVAIGLEKGGTYGPINARFLALPLKRALDTLGRKKRNYRTPKIAQAAGKFLFVFKSKRTGRLYLAEYTKKGRSGTRGFRASWKPTWLLVRSVTIKKTLRFIATWDELAPERDKRLLETKDSIVREIASAIRR